MGLSDDEMKKQYGSVALYHAQYLRYLSRLYNPRVQRLADNTTNRSTQNPVSREVDEIYRNYAAFQQLSNTKHYGHLYQGATGRTDPTPWQNGGKLFSLLERVFGALDTMFASTRATVESLDHNSITIRQDRLRLAKVKMALRDQIRNISLEHGIELMPEAGTGMNVEDFVKDGARSITNELEEMYINLMVDAENKARIKSKVCAAVQGSVLGKYGAVHLWYRNGRIQCDRIPPECIIRDTSSVDRFNETDVFRAMIQVMTPEQAALDYDLKPDERDHLLDKCKNNATIGIGNGLIWRSASPLQTTVITGYWLDYEPTRKPEKHENENDAAPEMNGDVILRKGVLIGDCIIKNYGIGTDVVYRQDRSELPEYPLILFSPGIINGYSRCPADRLYALDEERDATRHKIMQIVSKAKGKKHVFRGSKTGGMTASTISHELETMDITVIVDEQADSLQPGRNDRMAEVLDMTLDPNVHRLIQIIEFQSNEMEQMINTSQLAMGTLSRYVSSSQQRNAIEQSNNALHQYFTGGVEFYRRVMEHATRLCQVVLADPVFQQEAGTVLDKQQLELLRNIANDDMHDLAIRLDIEDAIDDKGREILTQTTLAYAQNYEHTGFGPEDVTRVVTARTYTELVNYFEERAQKIIADRKLKEANDALLKQIQMMQTQQAQVEMNAANNAHDTQMNEMAVAGALAKQGMQNEQKNSAAPLNQ